jgi:hypothetical protein
MFTQTHMLVELLVPLCVPLWESGFLIAEAAAAAFRVKSTAVRRFTPDGDTDVSWDTVPGFICSEDADNLTGVVGGIKPPDESVRE